MKVFLSWSGNRSRELALTLRQWLPSVIQSLNPWMSEEDIRSGELWPLRLSQELDQAAFGIVCVSPENILAPWLVFEAGALSKRFEQSRICPYLLDMEPSDLAESPLKNFQAARVDEAGTWKLIQSINDAQDISVKEDLLRVAFNRGWPEFAGKLAAISEAPTRLEDEFLPRALSERLRGITSAVLPGSTDAEARRLITIPRARGIKNIMASAHSPVNSPEQMVELILHSSTICLAGTALTDFRGISTHESVFRALFERLCSGELRFELVMMDPMFRRYFDLRSEERPQLAIDVHRNACDSFFRFLEMKAAYLDRVADPVERLLVYRNFLLATHQIIPRVSTLRFDSTLFSRPYVGDRRGGEAPYMLELEPVDNADSAYDLLLGEHERLRKHALSTLLPAWETGDPSDSWLEHRELVHRRGLMHPAVHLVLRRGNSLLLQLRSRNLTRNPGRWTSAVSGHVEARDQDDPLQTLGRELEEELHAGHLSTLHDLRLVGTVDLVSTGQAVMDNRHVQHTCNTRTSVYIAHAPEHWEASFEANEEVEGLRAFTFDEIREGLTSGVLLDAAGIPHRVAENLPRVLSMVLST